mmetsp:Transcript_67386/g.150386  ORF Transcript_67386/g.150386 Transcript_67386/m.150386 type:complete len:333 (-) Transcript_67386:341-1339(-)
MPPKKRPKAACNAGSTSRSPAAAASKCKAPTPSPKTPDTAPVDDDDDEVIFVCAKREVTRFAHARYDCSEHSSFPAYPERHCDHCWCAICQVRVCDCDSWAQHCTTTARDAQALAEARRQGSLRSRLDAAPLQPPPALGSAAATLLLDFAWLQLRHTALSWLTNCGSDADGFAATIVAVHEVSHETAQGVLAALQATNEVVEFDTKLHIHPTAVLGPVPPPPGPPGPPLSAWLAMPQPPPRPQTPQSVALAHQDDHQARMMASSQAIQQLEAWATYHAQQGAAAAQANAGFPQQAAAWVRFYAQQATQQVEQSQVFIQQLTQAWKTHYAQKR